MRPLYIFDLDGTLALIEHRLHFVEGEKKDWPSFFAACVDDVLCEPIADVLRSLIDDADVWIWSGRSDEVAKQTEAWLWKHNIYPHLLRMRRAGDYRPDDVVKAEWLDEMEPHDRARLFAVFDDRDRVVKLWRSRGICCLQVADGAF